MAAQAADVRVRVAALIPQPSGKLLLVRHVKDRRTYHLLPGGGVEAGETLAEALIREVREETGLLCRPTRPVFINDSIAPDGSRHVVQITFLAEAEFGEQLEPADDERVAGTDLVPFADLVELDLRPPMAEQIVAAAASDFRSSALYLGPLWADDVTGRTGTGGHAGADGATARFRFT